MLLSADYGSGELRATKRLSANVALFALVMRWSACGTTPSMPGRPVAVTDVAENATVVP